MLKDESARSVAQRVRTPNSRHHQSFKVAFVVSLRPFPISRITTNLQVKSVAGGVKWVSLLLFWISNTCSSADFNLLPRQWDRSSLPAEGPWELWAVLRSGGDIRIRPSFSNWNKHPRRSISLSRVTFPCPKEMCGGAATGDRLSNPFVLKDFQPLRNPQVPTSLSNHQVLFYSWFGKEGHARLIAMIPFFTLTLTLDNV